MPTPRNLLSRTARQGSTKHYAASAGSRGGMGRHEPYTSSMTGKLISDSLALEIVRPALDMAPDYAEMALDALTESPLVKEIPVVKSLVALYKTGMAIREGHFVKKLLMFLKEFHANSTENERTREYREQIETDSAFRERVTEHLLVIIDRFVTAEKARILAHLFRAHVRGDILWEDFVSLSIVLDALQSRSYRFLGQMAELTPPFSMHNSDSSEEAPLFAAGIANRFGTKFSITPLGQMLYTHGIKPAHRH
jgi:hypothetical protein